MRAAWVASLALYLALAGLVASARGEAVRTDGNRLQLTCAPYTARALRCTVWLGMRVEARTRAQVWADGTFFGAGPLMQTRRVVLERGRNELAVKLVVRRWEYAPARMTEAGPAAERLVPGVLDGASVGVTVEGREQFEPLETSIDGGSL